MGLILGLLPAVSRWTLSWHTCSQLRGDLLAMKDKQDYQRLSDRQKIK